MVKRKRCLKRSSYNCGATCISAKKICRVDGLQGQSVSILANFKTTVKNAKQESKASTERTINERLIDVMQKGKEFAEMFSLSNAAQLHRDTKDDIMRASDNIEGYLNSSYIKDYLKSYPLARIGGSDKDASEVLRQYDAIKPFYDALDGLKARANSDAENVFKNNVINLTGSKNSDVVDGLSILPKSAYEGMVGLTIMKSPRATYYAHDEKQPRIYIGDKYLGDKSDSLGTRESIFHELAHALEDRVPGVGDLSVEFLKSKSPTGEMETLGENFGVTYKGYKGDHMHQYVGRVYEPNPDAGLNNFATEVISMGIEKMSDGWQFAEFYNDYPDHANFILGVLLDNY